MERLYEGKKAELRSLTEEHAMQASQLKVRTPPPGRVPGQGLTRGSCGVQAAMDKIPELNRAREAALAAARSARAEADAVRAEVRAGAAAP